MDCVFPEHGRPRSEILDQVDALVRSMKEQAISPVSGKPDAPPHALAVETWARVSTINPNNGGVHTRSRSAPLAAGRRSPWEATRQKERELIAMLAGLYGLPAGEVDGCMTSGGTEGNLMGMWIGRNSLLEGPTPAPGHARHEQPLAVLAPRTVHHSVRKACNLLGLGEGRWVHCRRCGHRHRFVPLPNGQGLRLLDVDPRDYSLDLESCERQLASLASLGVRRALVVATLGATLTGTVDPVDELCVLIREVQRRDGLRVYLHLDAALGGLVLPFLGSTGDPRGKVDWERWPEVDSLSLDWHKMGWAPYGAGTFLCRQGLPGWVERTVGYTTTGIDDTVLGSRSGAMALACWAVVHALGAEGFRVVTDHCLGLAGQLHERLREVCGVDVLPLSLLNLVTLRLSRVGGASARARALLNRHHLFPELLSPNGEVCPEELYPIFLMPQLRLAGIQQFVAELATALT
jgi:tyrosine decarboxylase/aspartate 1-decarboxylase